MRIQETLDRITANFVGNPPQPDTQEDRVKQYDCDICEDKGFIFSTDERMYSFARHCECHIKKIIYARLKRSGLYNLAQKHSFENFSTEHNFQKHIKDRATEYLNQGKYFWFFIGGQVGAGKTHICTAVCKGIIDQGMVLVFEEYRNIIMKIKAAANNNEEYLKITNELKEAPALYLDDVFKTKAGESVPRTDIEHLFNIINHRYNNAKATVISSEKTISEITCIDEAIGSRIAEMAGCFVLNIDKQHGRNYRLRKTEDLFSG